MARQGAAVPRARRGAVHKPEGPEKEMPPELVTGAIGVVNYALPSDLLQTTLRYLGQKPYQEVAPLVGALGRLQPVSDEQWREHDDAG